LFNKKASEDTWKSQDLSILEIVAEEIDSFKLDKSELNNGIKIVSLLAEHTSIVTSKGDARRALKGNAVSVNRVKITDPEFTLSKDHLLQDKFILVDNGKKFKYIIEVS